MRTVFLILLMASCQRLIAQDSEATFAGGNTSSNITSRTTSKVSSSATLVTDIDGNVYNTVTIGTQVWMAENLKTTRYSDGLEIPLVSNMQAWNALSPSSEAFCWYNDDISNKEIYGALYTWAAAMNSKSSSNLIPSGVQGACPTGWHLPSDAEWSVLTDYLTNNGYSKSSNGIELGKSMAAQTDWISFSKVGTIGNDQMSNNSSGFAALPGGSRLYNGTFNQAGAIGNWWRSTEFSPTLAYYRYMSYCNTRIYKSSNNKQNGFSVRCVKDF